MPAALAARIALPRQMAVENDAHVDAAVLRRDQRVDDAVAVLPAQLADQEQAQVNRVPRAVDLAQDRLVRPVVGPVEHRRPPEGVQQVERRQRIHPVALDHPAPAGLEHVVQQPADAERLERHPRFPVAAPAVEGDVERAHDGVFVAEDHELVVHVRGHFGQGIARGADLAQQLDARPLQVEVVAAVGQRHLAPVHDDLHRHAAAVRVDQVADEIAVVDAVHADLDPAGPPRLGLAPSDHRIDQVVQVALGVVRMPRLPLGEFRNHPQRFDVVVHPVHVALERPGVHFVRPVRVRRRPLLAHVPPHLALVAEFVPVHKDVFEPRRDRPAVEVQDIGKLHAGDAPLVQRLRMDEEIARFAPVPVPFAPARIRVRQVLLERAVLVEHLEDHLHVHLPAPVHAETDPPPAQVEQLLELVPARIQRPEDGLRRRGVLFGEFHASVSGQCFNPPGRGRPGSKQPRTARLWSPRRPRRGIGNLLFIAPRIPRDSPCGRIPARSAPA